MKGDSFFHGLPARLTVEQTAELLGFAAHAIPVLVKAGLLKPLGRPEAQAPKFFSTVAVLARCNDEAWLDRASDVLRKHWRIKNARRRGGEATD